MKSPRETALVKTVIEYLSLRGWLSWRNNTGRLKVGQRLVSFGRVGSGDVFAVRDGVFLSVECKMPGRQPTEHQREWIDSVNRHGGMAMVVRSIEDLIRVVEGIEA